MERQTLKPNLITLTLSEDEFPNKEKDLPEDLILLYNSIPNFEIQWVKENTKAFKKLIPTLYKYRQLDCWICTIDDDWYYSENYIKDLVTYAEENFGKMVNPGMAGNWLHGAFACYHTSYFKDGKIFKLTPAQMIDLLEDDQWYSICYHNNGIGDISKSYLNNVKQLDAPEPLVNSYKGKKAEIIKKAQNIYNNGYVPPKC